MKFIPNKSFPHPVLSDYSDDYQNSQFQAAIKPLMQTDALLVKVRFMLSDEAITNLIKKGDAVYVVEVVCPQTFQRRVSKSSKTEMDIEFEEGQLFGETDIILFHNV